MFCLEPFLHGQMTEELQLNLREGERNISLLQHVHTGTEVHSPSYSMHTRDLFPGKGRKSARAYS